MRLLLFTATLVLVLPSFNHVAVAADATNAVVVELDRATLIKLPKGWRAQHGDAAAVSGRAAAGGALVAIRQRQQIRQRQ